MRLQLAGSAFLALAVLGAGATVATAESEMAPDVCYIRADLPNAANDAIVGREGCSNRIPGTGRIIESRGLLLDDVVGERYNGNAGTMWVYGSCGNGEGNYYSDSVPAVAHTASLATSGLVTVLGDQPLASRR